MKSTSLLLILGLSTVLTASFAHAGARTDADENLIASVCRSTAPVLVVDDFADNKTNTADIDLNGDGTYDAYHGEFVNKLVQLDGQKTIQAHIGTPVYPADLLHALQPYVAAVKSGKLKISWINFSQGFTMDIDSLNSLVGSAGQINDSNVYLYRDSILQAIWMHSPELQIKELYDEFVELKQLGIPVFVAAGNSGFKEVNIYSLFPDVHSVGALDLKGEKADYSADNSTVTIWRRGSILSYAVTGGIALGDDKTPDFVLKTPPVPQDILNELNGKDVEAVAKKIPQKIADQNDDNTATFFELAAKLPKGLYSTYAVARKTLGTIYTQAGYIESLGDYFYMDGVHTLPLFFVHSDPFSNKIVVKQGVRTPDGREFRNVLYGTSFASPSICDGEKTPAKYAL